MTTIKFKRVLFATALVFGSAAFFSTTVAQAQSFSPQFYLGGGIGQGKIKPHDEWSTASIEASAGIPAGSLARTSDDTDTAWKIYGGYQFHRNFAVEGGYSDLGEATLNYTIPAAPGESIAVTGKVNAWTLAGVGILPINNQFSLFGKLGLSRTELKATAVAAGPIIGSESFSAKKRRNRGFWGVGAQYDFSPMTGVRVEYEDHGEVGSNGESDDGTGRFDASAWFVSVIVRF